MAKLNVTLNDEDLQEAIRLWCDANGFVPEGQAKLSQSDTHDIMDRKTGETFSAQVTVTKKAASGGAISSLH